MGATKSASYWANLTGVSWATATHGLASGEALTLVETFDGGLTWRDVNLGSPDTANPFYNVLCKDPQNYFVIANSATRSQAPDKERLFFHPASIRNRCGPEMRGKKNEKVIELLAFTGDFVELKDPLQVAVARASSLLRQFESAALNDAWRHRQRALLLARGDGLVDAVCPIAQEPDA